MKSLRMNKVLGTIRRKNTNADVDSQPDSPEAVAANSVKAFCESNTTNNAGDEVLYLPPIVDAAESSPQAAAECARLVRKYLKRDYWTKPSYQYNAIMLMRILCDNPGPTFTRNMDQKFADTIKELLRHGRDPSVLQMLMETLHSFEATKAYDEGLALVLETWRKEKEKAQKAGNPPYVPPPRNMGQQPPFMQPPNQIPRPPRGLPNPVELASRLEEARTSAKLLQDVVANTPPSEVLSNDFMKEFADRCKSASRSVQGYMAAENPAPDNDTMESLIDTNEQLQASLHLHQRALLNARKQAGLNSSPAESRPESTLAPVATNGAGSSRRPSPAPAAFEDSEDYESPPTPPRKTNGKGKARDYSPAVAGSSRSTPPPAEEDPFRDPVPEPSGSSSKATAGSGEPRLAFEPWHPGFGTTPSYAGRQDSAVGKETMHGAVTGSSTRSSSKGPDSSSDIYDVTPEKTRDRSYRS